LKPTLRVHVKILMINLDCRYEWISPLSIYSNQKNFFLIADPICFQLKKLHLFESFYF